MRLRPLTVRDIKTFRAFLSLKPHELSVYAFESIYPWKALYEINWTVMGESLCVFFRDRLGCFLNLAPLAKTIDPACVSKAFAVMDQINKHKDISRIENVEEQDRQFYTQAGYRCVEKFPDYLCERQELACLKGNKFKSKRAASNHFMKHYAFEYLPFSLRYRDACLDLYAAWMRGRFEANPDSLYRGMLKDGLVCLKRVFDNYKDFCYRGALVKTEGRVCGFSLGFPLNKDTFCISYEITDLKAQGLSQFIFRRFCEELSEYRYINIMDDSGLTNLKKVKQSYHPSRLIPSYIVTRGPAD